MTEQPKLYEVKHPYYCEEGNFFTTQERYQTVWKFDSWEEFYQEASRWDDDMNYLFRWDWWHKDPDEAEEYTEGYPDEILKLFFFRQRKGFHVTMLITVTKEDEPAIREYLKQKALHLKSTWFPIFEE